MLQSRYHRNHQNHFIRLKISDNTLPVLLSLSTPNKYLLWEQIVENSVQGEKGFIEHNGFYLKTVFVRESNLFMKLCCQKGTEIVHSQWQVLKCLRFFVM